MQYAQKPEFAAYGGLVRLAASRQSTFPIGEGFWEFRCQVDAIALQKALCGGSRLTILPGLAYNR